MSAPKVTQSPAKKSDTKAASKTDKDVAKQSQIN